MNFAEFFANPYTFCLIRGLFQYGDLHFLFAQFLGGFGDRGNHSHLHRLQVRVGSFIWAILRTIHFFLPVLRGRG
jgi:hypothetical protein